jgi:hypothetical protein
VLDSLLVYLLSRLQIRWNSGELRSALLSAPRLGFIKEVAVFIAAHRHELRSEDVDYWPPTISIPLMSQYLQVLTCGLIDMPYCIPI